MSEDPVSSLLSLVSARSAISGGFTAGGAWAIRFPAPEHMKFIIVARGACWLTIGDDAAVRFREGEVYLLNISQPFVLASDLEVPPLVAEELYSADKSEIISLTEGNDFMFLGGHVKLDPSSGGLLLDALPATTHLRANTLEAGTLRWLIDHLIAEHQSGRPGTDFAVAQIAQMMFLQVFRAYLDTIDEKSAGRLRILNDARLAPAVRLIHANPGKDWRLTDLAKSAAMSRTAFAVAFKAVAGVAPLAYLTEWRMRLAEQVLRESDKPLVTVAAALGYTSESAFSTAFKRVTGRPPQRYRAAMRESRQSLTEILSPA